MNVAEDVGNSGLRETNLAHCTAFVQAEVKGLAVIDRKDVVEEWIVVGELDRRSHSDGQNMWSESLVFLHQARSRPGLNRLPGPKRAKPYHHVGTSRLASRPMNDAHHTPHVSVLGKKETAQHQKYQQVQPRAERRGQNRTPAATFTCSPEELAPVAGAVSRCRYSSANNRKEVGS